MTNKRTFPRPQSMLEVHSVRSLTLSSRHRRTGHPCPCLPQARASSPPSWAQPWSRSWLGPQSRAQQLKAGQDRERLTGSAAANGERRHLGAAGSDVLRHGLALESLNHMFQVFFICSNANILEELGDLLFGCRGVSGAGDLLGWDLPARTNNM